MEEPLHAAYESLIHYMNVTHALVFEVRIITHFITIYYYYNYLL
jgi:hypothetical protein